MVDAKPAQMNVRIEKEFKECQNTKIDGISVDRSDASNWIISVNGPKGSPYEGGKFKIKVAFPDNYPFKAPVFNFVTKIYHPNVNFENGEICQDMLGTKDWKPTKFVNKILESLYSLIMAPDGDQPINPDAAKEFVSDKKTYEKKAAEFTKKFAL